MKEQKNKEPYLIKKVTLEGSFPFKVTFNKFIQQSAS